MATNYLATANTLSGHSRFLRGVTWYYPVVDTLDRAGAISEFNGDPTRLSKLIPSLPTPNTGKVWRVKGLLSVTDDGFWIKRNQAPEGQLGQISVYLDAPAGSSLVSQLIASNGTKYQTVYNFDDDGYPSIGLINPDRENGLPKYGALHQNIPNGDYIVRAVNSEGLVLRSRAAVITTTDAILGDNLSITPPPPLPDEGSTETYTGLFVCDAGIPTHPDKTIGLDSFISGDVKVKYTGTYSPPNGKRLMFFIGDERGFITRSQLESTVLMPGILYMFVTVEVDNTNNDQESYYAGSPFRAEQSFIIH